VFGGILPAGYELYDGHVVYRVVPASEIQMNALFAAEKSGHIRFWNEPRRLGSFVDVQVAPEHSARLTSLFAEHSMIHSKLVDNVRTIIETEQRELAQRRVFKAGDHPSFITTNEYHNLAEINAYLDEVANTFSTATIVNIGTSFQNRPLRAIKIGNPGANKPAVFIDGCIHAREWLACATMIYVINEITTNANNYRALLDKIDIYVMPVVNVDGYTYTWTNDRLWRKTRSGPNGGCFGVDPNRNWNFQWMVAGSSSNPCAEDFGGLSAFSEPEPTALARFLANNNATIKSYFDIHTYSQDFMYPYGYAEVYPPDVAKIRALAARATAAITAVNNRRFQYGSIVDIVYPASGSSIDYTRALLNIDYSYAMELRPDGNAANGFVLPPAQIIAGASECWAGLQVVFQTVADEGM